MITDRILEFDRAFVLRLIQHLAVPLFVLDANRRVIVWNRACERLTGLQADAVLGTSEHWRAFYDAPGPCPADLLILGQAGGAHAVSDAGGFGLRTENWCIMPRVGECLYLMFEAGPIHDEDGRLVAVVQTMRDMTEQKRTHIALESLAIKDGLTGLANRRYFDEILEAEWLRAPREQQPISLLLADIDHFKQYNDTYGHQSGDECLREVAKVFSEQVFRPSDLAARYGGEEFAVIMPATNLDGARQVAQRIRDGVDALNVARRANGRDERPVTISIGIASLIPLPGTGSEDIVSATDHALYAAKAGGRNRIVVAETARRKEC